MWSVDLESRTVLDYELVCSGLDELICSISRTFPCAYNCNQLEDYPYESEDNQ